MIAQQPNRGCLHVMEARFMPIRLAEIDGVLTRQNGAVNQPVGNFIMF